MAKKSGDRRPTRPSAASDETLRLILPRITMGFLDWVKSLLGLPGPTGSPSPRFAPLRREDRRKLDLDLDQFSPLSDAEVKAAAKGLWGANWWGRWLGRRDVIPPVTDKRTLLIDRAMVGHGFLTPEELVEIHEVGARMDDLQPDLVRARDAAQAAVDRAKEEHKELKARKKREAEERRRRHAEEVAQRRESDIVYLGRGVSRGLADRRASVEKLTEAGLPVLATPADIARAIGTPVKRLRWLAFHSDAATRLHYVRFTVPKRGGGTRELAAPHRDLARAQEWILRNVLDKIPVRCHAHGFVKGRSTVTNASVHAGQAIVVNMDLKDFFPSVRFPRVRGALHRLGYSPAAATVMALLCTEAPRREAIYAGQVYHVAIGPRALPQGACTSPALSNLVARSLDARLAGIAAKLGYRYSRYADDLTFSGPPDSAGRVGYLMARVRHIARDEGFEVNEKKTRVLRRNTAQTVTGIVVNDRPGVPRREVRRLRAILHRARREGLAAQNREGVPDYESWLRGMVSYVSMVNPAQGQPLLKALENLGS